MTLARHRWAGLAVLGWLTLAGLAHAALPKVPEGFEIRLVAAVPAVEYPCQVATAPDGSLFVAEDPMDQVGPYEAKHGRILRFRDGKEPVVFADGFRAIFGMLWIDDSLYVSHMPYLTVLRDSDGDGKADRRRDLFRDLGQTDNRGLNDHIVSGIQLGIDGYLYISVGDKGIPKATGPDGRTVQLRGGGVVRCRPDGTGLEVFSSGTRNHLDPNLDDRDDLFTYDNTDDGDGWWTRVTHHVDGGYYGYPYDYHDRPDRMLPRMSEYGGGSPCGALFYKEDAWPERYRGLGFWAEWGKGKVQAFRFAPVGSTFKVAETIDFVVPEGSDTFRPIDLALSYDGRTLYVADWNMGGWGNRNEKVGRVFAVTWKTPVATQPRGSDADPIDAQIRQLAHPSFYERMRAQHALIRKGKEALRPAVDALDNAKVDPLRARHLVWVIDGIAGGTPAATTPLVAALKSPHADVRAQAARALGEREVHAALKPLISLVQDRDPTVRLQAVIALGRIGDRKAVDALLPVLAEKDEFLAFSARQALRRIDAWKTVAGGLKSRDPAVRGGILATLEQVYDVDAVSALATFAADREHPAPERARALAYLAQAHHKTHPWDGRWWGTRPTQGKPPAKDVDWEGTLVVLRTVRRSLDDARVPVRTAAIAAVRTTGDRKALPALRIRFKVERDPDVRRQVALALGALNDKEALPLLVAALRDAATPEPVREAALTSLETLGTDVAVKALIDLLQRGSLSAERQPRVIAALGNFKAEAAVPAIVKTLKSRSPAVRAAAAEALGRIGRTEGVLPALRPLLNDTDLSVRKGAIAALAGLRDRESIPALLKAAESDDTRFEASMALAALPATEALSVYLRGLTAPSPDLRKSSAEALMAIRDQAAPTLDQLAARHELDPALVPELKKVYTSLAPIAQWRILGPLAIDAKPAIDPSRPIDPNATHTGRKGTPIVWKEARAINPKGEINLGRIYSDDANQAAYGYAEIESPSERKATLALGSDDTLTVWVNGTQVYDFTGDRAFEAEKDSVEVTLARGTNRFLIRCGNHGGGWQFSVAVSAPTDYAFLKGPARAAFDPEAYRAAARGGRGNPEHGRVLFHDLKGVACVKCHTVGGQGGTVGPELSSVGAKYRRDELIQSVLNPSAQILQGYEPTVLATNDGRIITGIVKSETPDAVELEDAEARRLTIPKADIDERKTSTVSLMPNGLAEGLSASDFADLIAYLETLKQAPPGPDAAKPTGGR